MSAWIVSKKHIDILVQGLAESEIVVTVDPDTLGRELWKENHRSVNYRYSERSRTPSYTYTRPSTPTNPCLLEQQIACYQYQTCERPDWKRSKAHRWTTELAEKLAAARPCGTVHEKYTTRHLDGTTTERDTCVAFAEAPWGI